MKHTRKTVIALAESMGATFDTDNGNDAGMIYVDSPVGKVFACNGSHCIAESYTNNHGHSWKGEAWQVVGESLEMGLCDCDTPDCDICEDRAAELA